MDLVGALEEALRVGVGAQAAGYAIAALGLNLHFGYTGLLNFGHVGFFLVGAYGTGVAVDSGAPLVVGVVGGIAAAVVFALLLGAPTLRLRADYLAIVTIAAAEILRLVVRSNWARPVTGGVFGIQAVAQDFYDVNPIADGTYGVGGLVFSARSLWVITVGWALALLLTLLMARLTSSPWGRVLKAIREDEDAVRSLGKNVFAYKLQSLMVGGVLGALGGIALMLNQQSVFPDTYVAILTFYAYTVVILGGAGSVWGPVVGSIVFWSFVQLTESLLRQAVTEGPLQDTPLDVQDVAALRFALVGALLMALLVFRPQGIFGRREEMVLGD